MLSNTNPLKNADKVDHITVENVYIQLYVYNYTCIIIILCI